MKIILSHNGTRVQVDDSATRGFPVSVRLDGRTITLTRDNAKELTELLTAALLLSEKGPGYWVLRMNIDKKIQATARGWCTPWRWVGVAVGQADYLFTRMSTVVVWVGPLQFCVQWQGRV